MMFVNNAEGMGLKERNDLEGYYYTDRFSSVLYTELFTKNKVKIPLIGVFTGESDENTIENFNFVSVVSNRYNFIGNEIILEKIKQPIIKENTIFKEKYNLYAKNSIFYGDISVNNKKNISSVGDLYPQLTFTNSYTAKSAVNIYFGFTIIEGEKHSSFYFSKQKMGRIRQIHNINSKTELTSAFGNYVSKFDQGISQMVDMNMNKVLSKDNIHSTLNFLERLGKKRKKMIVSNLFGDVEDTDVLNITVWDLFYTIIRFTSQEKNLNIKLFLEDVVESFLVVPTELLNVIEASQNIQTN